ncbi:hypothetical protein BGZ94_005243, partial [Podila epigama]
PYYRRGLRVTVSGEKPYFEPESKATQAEAFAKVAAVIVAKQEAADKVAAAEKAAAATTA